MTEPSFQEVDAGVAERANRGDWDRTADDYQAEHGEFLRDIGFIWCPEGLDEADVGLLGDVSGRRVLEIGCGAAQCSRWLISQGALAIGLDLSMRQLQHSRRIDDATGRTVPVGCATVTALPVASESIDIVCSAFGGFPFVIDIAAAFAEARRVLRPGGRLVLSVVHPARWMFVDDPTSQGLQVVRSYFDRTPYVELDAAGQPAYVEPHHTIGDWTSALLGAGLELAGLLEPPWPEGHNRVWGGWGPIRGALVPGTLIICATRPG